MEEFKKICLEIKKIVPDKFKWEFDDRFYATLICVDKGTADSIFDKMKEVFGNCYDFDTIKKAPKLERKLSKALFGIDKDQYLFTATFEDFILFCTWWPWDENRKVSLRIGINAQQKKFVDENEDVKLLKDWFSLP